MASKTTPSPSSSSASSGSAAAAAATEQRVPQYRFMKQEENTDCTLQVDGGARLHFYEFFLREASPVLDEWYEQYDEGRVGEGRVDVPLPGWDVGLVDLFLQQLLPEPPVTPITDDVLDDLLAIAREFKTEVVRRNCLRYIKEQILVNMAPISRVVYSDLSFGVETPEVTCSKLSLDRIVFYLRVSHEQGFTDIARRLTYMAAGRSVRQMEQCTDYHRLAETHVLRDILHIRSLWLESWLLFPSAGSQWDEKYRSLGESLLVVSELDLLTDFFGSCFSSEQRKAKDDHTFRVPESMSSDD